MTIGCELDLRDRLTVRENVIGGTLGSAVEIIDAILLRHGDILLADGDVHGRLKFKILLIARGQKKFCIFFGERNVLRVCLQFIVQRVGSLKSVQSHICAHADTSHKNGKKDPYKKSVVFYPYKFHMCSYGKIGSAFIVEQRHHNKIFLEEICFLFLEVDNKCRWFVYFTVNESVFIKFAKFIFIFVKHTVTDIV